MEKYFVLKLILPSASFAQDTIDTERNIMHWQMAQWHNCSMAQFVDVF